MKRMGFLAFAAVLSMLAGAPVRSATEKTVKDDVIKAINKDGNTLQPNVSETAGLPLAKRVSLSASSGRDATRAYGGADGEQFLCVPSAGKTMGDDAKGCTNCKYGCRNRSTGAISGSYGAGTESCAVSTIPTCISADNHDFTENSLRVGSDGFLRSSDKVLDNVGNGYYYRYWDPAGAMTTAGGAIVEGTHSPAMPKVCYSGYTGLSSNNDTAKDQFASRGRNATGKPRRQNAGASASTRNAYNGGVYYIPVEVDVVSNGPSTAGLASFGTNGDDRSIAVRGWGQDTGRKCLYPDFAGSYSLQSCAGKTRTETQVLNLTDSNDTLSQSLVGCEYTNPKLPCGMNDASAAMPSGYSRIGEARYGTSYKCAASTSYKQFAGSDGNSLKTKLTLTLRMPSSGTYSTNLDVRECFVCNSADTDSGCIEIVKGLAAKKCGSSGLGACNTQALMDSFVASLYSPRDNVPYVEGAKDETFPILLQCDTCMRKIENFVSRGQI